VDLTRRLSHFSSREELKILEKLKEELKSPDEYKSFDNWNKNQSKEKLSLFVQP
jgi:hypothetical protein